MPITSNLTTWEEDHCPLQPLLIEKHLLFSDLHSQPPLSGKQVLIFIIDKLRPTYAIFALGGAPQILTMIRLRVLASTCKWMAPEKISHRKVHICLLDLLFLKLTYRFFSTFYCNRTRCMASGPHRGSEPPPCFPQVYQDCGGESLNCGSLLKLWPPGDRPTLDGHLEEESETEPTLRWHLCQKRR